MPHLAAVAAPSPAGTEGYGLEFYGEDVAYATGPGGYVGMPVEFIRAEPGGGPVVWVRVNGRIARRATAPPVYVDC